MGFSFGKSTNWAISTGVSLNYAYGGAFAAYYLTLLDVTNQIFFPALLAGAGFGGGGKKKGDFIPGKGPSLSVPSYTFFTVGDPMYASDFDNCVCALGDASAGVIVGASGTLLWIYGVSHSPSPINLSGFNLSWGTSAMGLIMNLYVWDKPQQNLGCAITPSGDPLCGGSSPPDPGQSTDPGVCQ